MIVDENQLAAFFSHGMEGMRLEDDTVAPPHVASPLQKRCACGRVISWTRLECRACYETRLLNIANNIHTAEDLAKVIAEVDPDRRDEFFGNLKPWLNFDPEKSS